MKQLNVLGNILMSWNNIEQLKICLDLLAAIINMEKFSIYIGSERQQKIPTTNITLNKNKCNE